MKTLVVVLLGSALAIVGFAGCPRCAGPDPRAVQILYELVSSSSPSSGTVRITGLVQNMGSSNFVSGQGQQSVYLYEGGDLVAQMPFLNLAVDATVEVEYERMWSLSDEFRPPSYTVMISYDPDIFIDGNPQNDDCRLSNNDYALGTSGLDALFTR